MRDATRLQGPLAGALLTALVGLSSCAGPGGPGDVSGYRYFERPDPDDPWSLEIGQWQASQREEEPPPSSPESGTGLQAEYLAIRSELRLEQARRLTDWIQDAAPRIYAADTGEDHWPTLDEVLASEADDCDGLELLVHQLLLDLGFPSREVYRAVVHHPSDGRYHMVTLWFEDPEDPWVIDPTGAMTPGLRRMSEIPGWVPLKLFSPTEEFTVRHARRRR